MLTATLVAFPAPPLLGGFRQIGSPRRFADSIGTPELRALLASPFAALGRSRCDSVFRARKSLTEGRGRGLISIARPDSSLPEGRRHAENPSGTIPERPGGHPSGTPPCRRV